MSEKLPLDPTIYFFLIVPDWRPEEATPTQGFAPSLCADGWLIGRIALLPTNIYDFTDEGRETLLARRMSGTYPVNWHGQSPRAIRAMPFPASLAFTLIILPESESARDYESWANSSNFRPTIVAKAGGELNYKDLTEEGLKAQFLTVCDRIPKEIDQASIDEARQVIKQWKPMPPRKLPYQVGGHNTVSPNLTALSTAGFDEMVYGRFNKFGRTIQPYVDDIVLTTNSVLDERALVGDRDFQRIFPQPPDINLFAPSIFPKFFDATPSLSLSREEKKRFILARQALERQSGYAYETRTPAQHLAVFGKNIEDREDKSEPKPHPLMIMRGTELRLNTNLMSALAASEFSAVIRLPNDINRTIGSIRNFAQHYRSEESNSRKRLLSFRQVQARIASAIPPEFTELIKRSKTGIRIVSDAHIEWMNIDGLPLVIRKNCSRIPVTPGNIFVDQVSAKPTIHLQRQNFKSVLVISALKQDDPISSLFEDIFGIIEPEWRENLTVKFAKVANEEDFVEAINGFDGPLIIFDGHGSHLPDEPGKIHLGDDVVDVWNLKDKIHKMPPIVVLSACDTHAADRNHATTANGFLSLGARTVLSSVFPLNAPFAAMFTGRLVLRVAQFLGPVVALRGRAITWLEVVSGMLRTQLMTEFMFRLLQMKIISPEKYEELHLAGCQSINDLVPDPFGDILDALEGTGIYRQKLNEHLEFAIANSSVISYLQIGRPETIIIDDAERVKAQYESMDLAISNREKKRSKQLQ